ncbi:hypothetical protein N7454_008653 [Penicillium verhagenii]|nr:hypothetical protein N7454_008653 [Penicillium verhagenii]
MESSAYSVLCEEIYKKITDKLQGKPEDGRRFAVRGTAKEVLNDDLLGRFFGSLSVSEDDLTFTELSNDLLIRRVAERDLYDFLATLIFITCSIHAARTFTTELVAQDAWPVNIYKLPVSREALAALFLDPVTPDKFLEHQACFCPMVIYKRQETRIENPERQRLPYLEETFLSEGSFGAVYKVKIAKGHFFDTTMNCANDEPIEIARKDYITAKRSPRGKQDEEALVMQKILSAVWSCKNVVESYGSFAVGPTTYSLFMPLAMCDLWAYMMQYTPQWPDKAAIIFAAQGLANGLNFLHNGIKTTEGERLVCYHMDLKPKNILVFSEEVAGKVHYVWKISDFGMSRVKRLRVEKSGGRSEREDNFNDSFVRREQPEDPSGTMNRRDHSTYLAPESISANRDMKASSDVWSLGCVISVLFAYLESGADGVTNYSDKRVEYRKSEGFDRFFVRDGGFKPYQVNPAVKKFHDALIIKARTRNPNEGTAVRLILEHLENDVLKDQSKRCTVSVMEDMIRATYMRYKNLEQPLMERKSVARNQTWIASTRDRISTAVGYRATSCRPESRVEKMFLDDNEPFKGCEISPDGHIVAFWTDFKITIYTSNTLPLADVAEPTPVAKSAAVFTISDCIWKSVSITDRYLVASTSGANFEVGDPESEFIHSIKAQFLTHKYSVTFLISKEGPRKSIVFILRDTDDENKPGTLYRAPVTSVESCQRQCELDWPAADAIKLFFATNEDIWIIFRPHLTSRDWDHKIPIFHISLESKRIDPLTVELQGFDINTTVGIFTTLAPFNKVSDVCAVVTREDTLHIRSLDPVGPIPSVAADIHTYRVLKLMMGWDDKRLFAVGKKAANHKMLLLEMTMPTPRRKETLIKELAELPGLSDDDEFTERLSFQGDEKFILIAALTNDNRRALYRFRIL